MFLEMVDNTNAASYAGFELVDTSTIPPCTFAVGLPKEYAEYIVKAVNAHDTLVDHVRNLMMALEWDDSDGPEAQAYDAARDFLLSLGETVG